MMWMQWGAGFMFAAVALGAFAAHGLKNTLSPYGLGVFDTAVRYHAIHGLALLAVGWLAATRPSGLVTAAGWSFVAGIFVFSGSLYALALTEQRWLGALTPIGGLAFLVGWALVFWAAARKA